MLAAAMPVPDRRGRGAPGPAITSAPSSGTACVQPRLCDESVGEPGAGGAPKTVSLGGSEGAGQHPDQPACGEPAEFACQIANHSTVRDVAKFLQHRAEVFSREQILGGSRSQPAPSQKHAAGGANIITGLR
jgi:hypothetical protein